MSKNLMVHEAYVRMHRLEHRFTNFSIFQVAAIVPDLINVIDSQSGSHLGTQACQSLATKIIGRTLLMIP